jgi:hypothetical protein
MKNVRVEILVEEQSMQLFLTDLLDFILPQGYRFGSNVYVRPFEGKQDLQKGLARWVRVLSNFHQPARLIVIHDQDSSDCRELKAQLRVICERNGDCPVLIRIACRELENWYLGDLLALQGVYPSFNASAHLNKARYRSNVDNPFGTQEIISLIPAFEKTLAASEVVLHMVDRLAENRSESFQQTVSGIQHFLTEEE